MTGSIKRRILRDGSIRYDVIWRTPTGKQKWKSFKKKKDADNFITKTVQSVQDGSYTELRPVPMDELFDKWVEEWLAVQEQLGKPKRSTGLTYRHIVDRYFRPTFRRYRSDQLSADIIGDWVKCLADRIGKGTLRPKTYNNVVTLLAQILKWGRRSDQRYLRHDPMEHVKRLPKQQIEREVLEPSELWTLLTAAKASPPDDSIVQVFAFSGLRRGETFGLKWGDVQRNPDGTGGRLFIRRAIVSGQVTTPKTKGSVRMVDIPKGLVDELYLYRASYPPMEGDWIFHTEKGTPLDPDNWYKRHFLPLLQGAGLRHIGLHILRHTYVSILIDQGESIKYVSRQVGHTTVQMTLDVYGHLFKETSTTAMNRLDQRLRTSLLDESKSSLLSNKNLTEPAGTAPKTVEDDASTDLANLLEDQRKEDITVTA